MQLFTQLFFKYFFNNICRLPQYLLNVKDRWRMGYFCVLVYTMYTFLWSLLKKNKKYKMWYFLFISMKS